MCGIAGLVPHPFGRALEAQSIHAAMESLAHRGPDDQGYVVLGADSVQTGRVGPSSTPAEAALIHRRLSILDLGTSGHQPMSTPDGRYHLVFNGEIYNYRELRLELGELGYRFCSNSDTEVLLAAFAQWGRKSLTRLVGMFAFAVLDVWERRLFLARDFLGIKPLYYAVTPKGFAFASEIKTLLDLLGVRPRVNPERLHFYLRHGVTDFGGETLFADVFQVPAAHLLEFCLKEGKAAAPVRFWQPRLEERLEVSFSEAAGRLRTAFLDSVQMHLRSDVPVGAALSGGVDSASIVMAMRHLQGGDLDLHAFSYVADDPGLSEERWVDLVGSAAGARVHKVRAAPEDLVAHLDDLVGCQGEPFQSTSVYAQFRVFRLARENGVKVMLDGQGADELLGGYQTMLAARLASLVRQGKWSAAAQFLRRAGRVPKVGHWSVFLRAAGLLLPQDLQGPARRAVGRGLTPDWLNAGWFRERGVVPRSLGKSSGSEVLRSELIEGLLLTSLPMLLRYEDRNSMAFSVESRVPFLTPALVELVLSLPEEYIIASDGTSKAVFREAMRGIVPQAILDRRDKIGFETPERAWVSALRPSAFTALDGETSASIPAWHYPEVRARWQAAMAGREAFRPCMWRWFNLVKWVEQNAVTFE